MHGPLNVKIVKVIVQLIYCNVHTQPHITIKGYYYYNSNISLKSKMDDSTNNLLKTIQAVLYYRTNNLSVLVNY